MIEILEELKVRAEDSTQYRLHELGQWTEHSYKPTILHNACIHCGMDVSINARPLPNEIDIGGEAVALNCGDKT